MPKGAEGLYRLARRDVARAGAVCADAFRDDPIWTRVLAGVRTGQKRSVFEVPIRYCLTYGEVYAPSEAIEGLITWIPGHLADMTFGRLLRSGAFWSALRGPVRALARLGPVFRPIERDQKAHMAGIDYLYLPLLGVASASQGQGVGSRLLGALIELSERQGLPVYLETETERNVAWYEKRGFEVVKAITLPVIDLPMWEMVRRPAG